MTLKLISGVLVSQRWNFLRDGRRDRESPHNEYCYERGSFVRPFCLPSHLLFGGNSIQDDPPTLDREGGTYKYSRTFKEVVEWCLNKDPAKRCALFWY